MNLILTKILIFICQEFKKKMNLYDSVIISKLSTQTLEKKSNDHKNFLKKQKVENK